MSDYLTEATAANEAGFGTCLVSRDGNAALTDEDKQTFNMVNSFAELTSADNSKL